MYAKDRNEHWDDYHLRSAELGGNKKLFAFLKENDMDKAPHKARYLHPITTWYKNRHKHILDTFDESTFAV